MSQESAQVESVAITTQEVLRITISDVLGLLAQGRSRKEIAEHYGRTQSDMNKMVWGHPKLKNRKAKKQYTGIELEDDTDDVAVAEVAHVPGPELTQAFENVEEMGTDANEEATPVQAESDWN
jgi:hypothetical protein